MNRTIQIAAIAACFLMISTAAESRRHSRYHYSATRNQGSPVYTDDNNGRLVYSAPAATGRAARTSKRGRVGHRHARRHKTSVRASNSEQGQSGITVAQNGIIYASTGATAHVAPAFASRFQAYIRDLEAAGARILDMGGYRRGRCSPGHQHPCGKALDVCQKRRGIVDSRCHLPDRPTIAAIAKRNGLFEGGQWCNQDYGHAQVSESSPACGEASHWPKTAKVFLSTASWQP